MEKIFWGAFGGIWGSVMTSQFTVEFVYGFYDLKMHPVHFFLLKSHLFQNHLGSFGGGYLGG